MRTLFRFIFRTINLLLVFFGVLLVGVFAAIYLKMQNPALPVVSENSVLTIRLEGQYIDHVHDDFSSLLFAERSKSLYQLISSIKFASRDPRIKGILLDMWSPDMGFAQAQELRQALLEFRKAGKRIYAYSDTFGGMEGGNLEYFIASSADKIYMQWMGQVGLSGVSLESPYLKGVLDKIGVKPEFSQRKEYKSFPEMFTQEHPTDANAEAIKSMGESFYSQLIQAISTARGLKLDRVVEILRTGGQFDKVAVSNNLIDGLTFREDMGRKIADDLKVTTRFIDQEKYAVLEAVERMRPHPKNIAIIFDGGAIVSHDAAGEGAMNVIDSMRTAEYFKEAINDKTVEAIVYRVDSPGGDPVASHTIANMILKARSHGKPVVISMGNAAASGGYWISCVGNKIVANPGTITGSIGVFAGKMSLAELWSKIGVNWGRTVIGGSGGELSPNQDFSEEGWNNLNLFLDLVYERFVSLVSRGRNLPPYYVDKIARGRVWTGEQALALNLVDHLGGLEDAIVIAAKEAEISGEYGIKTIPAKKSFAELLYDLMEGNNGRSYPNFLAKLHAFCAHISKFYHVVTNDHALYDSRIDLMEKGI